MSLHLRVEPHAWLCLVFLLSYLYIYVPLSYTGSLKVLVLQVDIYIVVFPKGTRCGFPRVLAPKSS
jgi:hypothetical protein